MFATKFPRLFLIFDCVITAAILIGASCWAISRYMELKAWFQFKPPAAGAAS